ncbi:hypothetical protein HDU88_002435 [Geranomyces variabilis]|nr:hypothetical protein HDU88_002435 [Geranomyces variabilis]
MVRIKNIADLAEEIQRLERETAAATGQTPKVEWRNVKDAKAHSEGDTYKLIENSVYALREILAAHKDVSLERMKTMQVLSVQMIKNRATLMTTRVTKGPAGMSWEVVELRSAQLPAYWSQLTKVMLIVEMVAAAYQAVDRSARHILRRRRRNFAE